MVQMYPWHPSLRRIHRHAQEAADKLKKHLVRQQQQQQAMEELQNSANQHLRAGESLLSVDSSTQQDNGADDDTVQLAHLIAMSKPAVVSDDYDDGHNASSMSVVTGMGGLNGSVRFPLDTGGGGSLASANASKTVSNPLSLLHPSSTLGIANNASVAGHTLSSGGTAAAQMGLGITKGAGTSILQSLGDQQWLTASQHAEVKLDDALRAAEKGVDRAMNNAKRAAAAVATPVSGSMLWKDNNLNSDSTSVVSTDRGYIDVMMGDIIAKSNLALNANTPPTTAKVSRPNALLKALQDSAGNTPNDTEPPSMDVSPTSSSQLLGDGDTGGEGSTSQRNHRFQSVSLAEVNAAKPFSMSDVESMLDEAKRKEDEENFVPEEDPVEVAMVGQSSLPEYLRGGSVSQGLGALMGNALSLLFVARHGLKEAELWAMLATLRARPPEYIEMLQRQRVQQEASRAVLQICYVSRADLEDNWRVEDHVRTGMLTLAQLQRGMLKTSKDLKRGDLMRLLQITGLMAQEAIDAGFVTGNTGGETSVAYEQGPNSMDNGHEAAAMPSPEAVRVYFPELLHRIMSGEKRERWNVHRRHLGLHHEHEHIGLGGVVVSSDTKSVGSQDDFHVPGNGMPATNVPFSTAPPKDPFNSSGVDAGGSSASVLGDDLATLGPVIEENLLELLTALGALHSPEHQVILLPSENHSFRSVIRSIVEQRGGEEAWHGHMIRYFQKLPNTSMRRCEELPWHLQLCRKWYVLKDALSDLKTFDMMYSSDDLKDELLSYWRLLTEGPLCILSDEQLQAEIDERLSAIETQKLERVTALWRTAREAKSRGHSRRSNNHHPSARFTARGVGNDRDSSDAGTEQVDLDDLEEDELDPAHFPDDHHEARCRQIIMSSVSNDVGPFDIVEEFNRSVETWVLGIGAPASSIPGAAQINATILHIGQFIAEFSVRGGSSPPFLRLGVGLDALSMFKVAFGSIQELLVPEDKDDIVNEEPYLATTKTLVGVKPKTVVPMFPTRQMENSHLYLYLRWIWIQFPWLALMHAGTCVPGPTASAAMQKRNQSAYGNSLFDVNGSLNSMGEVVANVAGGQLTDGAGDFADLTLTNEKNNGRRFWTVKKADPTVALFEYTQPKRAANINAAITPNSYMNTIEVVVQRVRDDIKAEMTDPDNRLTPVKEKIDVSVKRLPRFRRSLEQDVVANKQVLHAGHSLKTQLKGTMFPSIEMQRKAAYKKIEDDHPGLYVAANLVKRRGGQSDPFGPSVEEEIRQLRDSEELKDYNDKRGYPIALTSEDAVYYEKECLRVEKLRKLMDRVTAKVAERKADLKVSFCTVYNTILPYPHFSIRATVSFN